MLLSERIAEIEATGAKVIVQQKRLQSEGVHVVDAYVFLPEIDGVRQTEKLQLFVAALDTVDEAASYIAKKPTPLVTKQEETPIATEADILAATGVKWIKYEIAQKEDVSYVNGVVSLSEKEAVNQSWIVKLEKGALVAYEQK